MTKLTAKQKRKFLALCDHMAELLEEIQKDAPDTVFFIDDGIPMLVDWPSNIERCPNENAVFGVYWHKSGGGGK